MTTNADRLYKQLVFEAEDDGFRSYSVVNASYASAEIDARRRFKSELLRHAFLAGWCRAAHK